MAFCETTGCNIKTELRAKKKLEYPNMCEQIKTAYIQMLFGFYSSALKYFGDSECHK